MDNKFIILVCEYNTAPYIKRCLDSVCYQDYKNYEVVVVDDCSTDSTVDIVKEYPATIIRNKQKEQYYFNNFIKGINLSSVNGEDIFVLVGGDDYLIDNSVLSYLNEVYQKDIWMTYGQFVPISGIYPAYCKPIPDIRTYRKCGKWYASHLITFKHWLWDKINDEDFRINGEYSNYACDASFMYPMIEMCGESHIKFIEKVLYVYNDINPESITNSNPKMSKKEAEYFRNKPCYDRI